MSISLFRKSTKIKKVNVGCGPKARPGWINVDIQSFPSVDKVMDVTQSWDFKKLDYVYSEHFLEHLAIDKGIEFLVNAGKSLKNGGFLRLSTPNVEWVLKTHYKWGQLDSPDAALNSVAAINRAFYGWGHRFLYSPALLKELLSQIGYKEISFKSYGESDIDEFKDIEMHGGYSVFEECPSVIIIEAKKEGYITKPELMLEKLNELFIRHSEALG